MPDMGTFRIDVEVENPLQPSRLATLHSVLVDTGAELSWFPASVLESLGIEPEKALALPSGERHRVDAMGWMGRRPCG